MDHAREEFCFQTKSRLRSLLDSAGLAPKRRFGQCFLIDRNLMQMLVRAAELTETDCALEVGCGTGSLTSLLAAEAGRVIAVDVDARLVEIARRQLDSVANVELLTLDALRKKSSVAPEIERAVLARIDESGLRAKLVANLPYDIATPLVLNLLLGDVPIIRYCFTVQCEVADRFLAEPDTSAYGPVSIVTQVLAAGRRIAKVPPQAFWPAPKVSSSMIRLDAKSCDEVGTKDPAGFARFVREVFRYRRKTMSHTAKMLGMEDRLLPALEAVGVGARARPQTITVGQWVGLYERMGCHGRDPQI